MNGIICIDKPKDMTSFTVTNRVRRILGVKKAGHTGTLDPMATGVLPIALSNSTRFIELLPTHDKSYCATVKLGLTTDTLDITGTIIDSKPVNVTIDEIKSTTKKYIGDILQTPPMYSAISKNGVRLYQLARQGIEIERQQRNITIFSIDISDFTGTEFKMNVSCSAGTYIRSLCDDIGRDLGCGAIMSELRRTTANGFSLNDCCTLEELEQAVINNTVNSFIKPIDICFESFKKIIVTAPQANRFHNGGGLLLDRLKDTYNIGLYKVYSPENHFLGIGEIALGSDTLAVKKVFVNE